MCSFPLFFFHFSFSPNSISNFQKFRIRLICCLFFEMPTPRASDDFYRFFCVCWTLSLIVQTGRARRDLTDLYTKVGVLKVKSDYALAELGIRLEQKETEAGIQLERKEIWWSWSSIETLISLEGDLIQHTFCAFLLCGIRRYYVQPWSSIGTVIGLERDSIQYLLFVSVIWYMSALSCHNRFYLKFCQRWCLEGRSKKMMVQKSKYN